MVKVLTIEERDGDYGDKYAIVRFQAEADVIVNNVMRRPKATLLVKPSSYSAWSEDQILPDYEVWYNADHAWKDKEGVERKGRWSLRNKGGQ